ncbi:MAG: 5-amino-6-(D-ribitylamino)uracil--L-tyrosine 4-hydroxyphenyl transferase CofH [SAR324 cluster bacterium]|nr:5-amino-6-(D-ribitylamino)uracil--L-tyrosine 4-hydroxyphenyl transferase CofH [SAR324 cluster bacterium]
MKTIEKNGFLPEDQVYELLKVGNLEMLMKSAAQLRDQAHRQVISYSRKVFVPLTQLCRDVCHYCTFAQSPVQLRQAFMTPEEVLESARRGAAAGCREVLFTLGDKPELRYSQAREELEKLGHKSTLSYLREVCDLVIKETGLLPHTNPGLMNRQDLMDLREVSVSQGIMLESLSPRLFQRGGPHFGSPDKDPKLRLETIRLAGELAIPFTSGILIGIGESRRERIEALLALRSLHHQHQHIQEIIIQNFCAKAGTQMASSPEPSFEDFLWTIAIARLIFGADMNIQAPPNLSKGALARLIDAGINDWGGVSPVTPDFVNPEKPWPHLESLALETAQSAKILTERLAIYPQYALQSEHWLHPQLGRLVIQKIDSEGFGRTDNWSTGSTLRPPIEEVIGQKNDRHANYSEIESILQKAMAGDGLNESEVIRLFQARGGEVQTVCAAADRLRKEVNGDEVSYVVTRNINYTNICYFRCQFCAFSKGKLSENLRGKPYDLDLEEIKRRAREAWERGATELCLQGGIHPEYSGETYLTICRELKAILPDLHLHAFSPLEIWQGAHTLGMDLADFLRQLKEVGLGSLPGTAAEVLDDEVRAILCPDKVTTQQWLAVMEAAHSAGFQTTATIMYGHIDHPRHWASHLLRIKDLQKKTHGFTELVPLPFVHMESPIYLKGRARKGPTFREAVLMHAVSRVTLHPDITNIQASWVKMGPVGVQACLNAGVNDLGGTLMNETITRSAGASHGQEMPPEQMERLIRENGRTPVQRSTTYERAPHERTLASYQAPPLSELVNSPAKRYERTERAELIRPGLSAENVGDLSPEH